MKDYIKRYKRYGYEEVLLKENIFFLIKNVEDNYLTKKIIKKKEEIKELLENIEYKKWIGFVSKKKIILFELLNKIMKEEEISVMLVGANYKNFILLKNLIFVIGFFNIKVEEELLKKLKDSLKKLIKYYKEYEKQKEVINKI